MGKRYYSVLVQWERGDDWSVQFGDYSRSVCVDEIEDSYSDAYKTKIITTDDKQSAIDAAVATLNFKGK